MAIKTNNKIKNKVLSPEDIVTSRYYTSKDITTYNKISIIRGAVGGVCIGVGIITLPFPTGSIFLIMFGSGLLGYDVKDLIRRLRYEVKLRYLRCFR